MTTSRKAKEAYVGNFVKDKDKKIAALVAKINDIENETMAKAGVELKIVKDSDDD